MVNATCAALHCLSSSKADKDLRFHQFPHDAERRKIWIIACRRTDVLDKDWDFFKHKYLCNMHFQKCMYSIKGRLKKSAIPSLHLSEKPLQHNCSTQTVESIKYVNQQSEDDVSILYVVPNEENRSTTSYTQTEGSLPYDIKNVNIKEEVITHTKIEKSESVEQDVEMKTETDDYENSDTETFEENEEIKIEVVENEILPLLQSTHSSQSVDLEKMKDGGTTQTKNLILEIDQGLIVPIVNRTRTDPTNTTMIPILNREINESVQTDRVIVLSQNADESTGSLNPEECECNRDNYSGMTRLEFYRACNKFLSANLALTVKRRMHLDDVTRIARGGRMITGVDECDELDTAEWEELIAPDVVIAGTETTADTAKADLDAVGRVEAALACSAAASSTACDQSNSTKASTTEVQTITSRKKTNAQRCREYRERKKLQNTIVQNITAERSDECSDTDKLQAKKPKTNAERRKKHYEAQKLKKQASKKIPKTVKQKNKEYYDRKKKIQALNTLNHHSDASRDNCSAKICKHPEEICNNAEETQQNN